MTARQKCISLAKEIAKIRDGFVCQKCGKKSGEVQIQGSHILPVSAGGFLACDPENVIALCAGDHMWKGDSWHESPLENSEWFNKKFPGRYEMLKSKQTKTPIKKWQWEERLTELKQELKTLKST